MTSGGLAAVSSSAFAALYSAFGKYDVVHIHAEGPAFFAWLPKMFGKRVVVTVHGIDWQREKWQSGLGSKFIHQGEKNAAKYADEVIVLSKGVQDYFKETYGRETHFIPNGVNTESLEVQISYIKEYINHRDDLMLLDVFADKRCTGMNFDRPEFERLLKALQERKVNCIVVKDFSRLGRNFVETGQYLEQVFPLFGVRFIAINDNYDSLNSQSRDGMLVPIKSMINEMYSKDLSQKIQSCFRSKEARGEIYTPVPFGYKKDQRNHLVLDEEVSDL